MAILGRSILQSANLPNDVPKMADTEARKQSVALKTFYGTADGNRVRESIRGKLTGKAILERRKTKSWPIVRLLTSGSTTAETAHELKMTERKSRSAGSTVQYRATLQGLALGKPFICDQGEVLTYGSSLTFARKICGFHRRAFVESLGLPAWLILHAPAAPQLVDPYIARTFLTWRNEVIRALLHKTRGAGGARSKFVRADAVLKTFFPRLAELNTALLATFQAIKTELAAHAEWEAEEVCEFVCLGGEREHESFEKPQSGKQQTWRRTERFLWQVEPSLPRAIERLRAGNNVGTVVRQLIGSQWDASEQTVQNAMKPNRETVSSEDLHSLILEYVDAAAMKDQADALRHELEKTRALVPKPRAPTRFGPAPKPEKRKDYRIRTRLAELRPIFREALEKKENAYHERA